MNPLDDLMFHIRRAFGIPADRLPEVASITHEKFRARVRGGWLLNLVIGAAARHYEIDPKDYVLDENAFTVKDVKLRIEGLSKVVAANEDDAKQIAILAQEELAHRIEDGYAAKMARNEWRSIWRQERRQEERSADAAKADQTAHRDWVRGASHRQREVTKDERDERLRLKFGEEAKGPPHEMLAFAWLGLDWSTGGRTPQAVVEDLGSLTLPQLAESWIHHFAAIEERKVSEAQVLFRGMTDQARKRRRLFFRYWDPRMLIDKWVDRIEQVASSGVSRVSSAPAHMRIAWLYRNKLGYSAERIVADLGPRNLDQLLADFVPEFAEREGTSGDAVRSEFKPFLGSPRVGAEPFSRFYKPHRKVLNWQYNVSRRGRSAEHSQLRSALEIITSERIESWKLLAFLHCHCLGRTPAAIAKEYGSRSLELVRDGLVQEFAEQWNSTPKHVRISIAALSQALLVKGSPPSLGQCPRQTELTDAVREWSEEILVAVKPKFATNEELRLFALRHRLAPVSEKREARSA